ncbi:hypothetical protein L218DRAFT_956943 [Marasmius fiardii PR-910]|nr:hypothetical protein L218DRAFT_956943 [Marasmius fiardii PR-910]
MPFGISSRSAFTDAEDSHLVEYMARFSSDKGRKGNRLYNSMVENLTGQSAWAASHPWQSWRDRYVKNSDYFDKRIRIYQKKNGLWKPGVTEGASKDVKQSEEVKVRKRKIIYNTSQENGGALKKQRVLKTIDSKEKGKDVQEDPELHLFVAYTKIPPRRREKADIDQVEDGGRHQKISASTAQASSKPGPRQVARGKLVDSGSPSNKQNTTQEARNQPSTSQVPRRVSTTAASSQTAGKEGKAGTQRTPGTKSPSPTSLVGNENLENGTRPSSEPPLFTQRVESEEPGSPLFTQRVKDARSRRGSDEEDDSMVNNLVNPADEDDDQGAESGKADDGEPDEEYPLLHPLLQSPEEHTKTLKSLDRSSTNNASRNVSSTSNPQTKDDARLKAKSKQPPKYLEGPFRTGLVGSHPPRAGSDDSDSNSDAAADLIPQVGGKKAVKKVAINQAKPSTSKRVEKRSLSDRSGASSSASSTESTPTPPRKRPRPLDLVSSRNVVLSSDPDVGMNAQGHDENVDSQVVAPIDKRRVRTQQIKKAAPDTDEEDEKEEEEEEAVTEVEDADEVHPFDTASQPPRTPKSTRHPFDMSQSQMHSYSSVRSHVSERDMERVIKTLERFISKLDTDRRERLLERSRWSLGKSETDRAETNDEEKHDAQEEMEVEEAEEEAEDVMVIDEDDQQPQPKLFTTALKGNEQEHAVNLRERGSPLPMRKSKTTEKSMSQPTSTDSGVPPQSSGELPPSSPPLNQSSEGNDQDESIDAEEAQEVGRHSVSPEKVATEPGQVEGVEEETQMTHDSLFSSSETSDQRQSPKAEVKGKARAIDPPDLFNDEDVTHRRHTIGMVGKESEPAALDLRRFAIARRRSLPSRSSASSISFSHENSSTPWRTSFELEKPLKMRLSETDQTKLIEMNVERMAMQYGFPASFVFGIWNDCGSLDEAETILSELGSKLEDLLDKSRRRRSSVGLVSTSALSRTDAPREMNMIVPDSDVTELKSVPSSIQIRTRSTASSSRPTLSKRNSPQFKPTLVDDDEIPDSDYSPPIASRAGKFRRLSRQGRFEEALERETKRASGGKSFLKGTKS